MLICKIYYIMGKTKVWESWKTLLLANTGVTDPTLECFGDCGQHALLFLLHLGHVPRPNDQGLRWLTFAWVQAQNPGEVRFTTVIGMVTSGMSARPWPLPLSGGYLFLENTPCCSTWSAKTRDSWTLLLRRTLDVTKQGARERSAWCDGCVCVFSFIHSSQLLALWAVWLLLTPSCAIMRGYFLLSVLLWR